MFFDRPVFPRDGEKCAVKSFKKHGLSEKRRGDLKNEAVRNPVGSFGLDPDMGVEPKIWLFPPKSPICS